MAKDMKTAIRSGHPQSKAITKQRGKKKMQRSPKRSKRA